MKRLLALILGAFGLRALLRRSRPVPLGPSPADDLRAKLAGARAPVEDAAPPPPPQPEPEPELPPEPAPDPEPAVDDRRADVHARARRVIDELKD